MAAGDKGSMGIHRLPPPPKGFPGLEKTKGFRTMKLLCLCIMATGIFAAALCAGSGSEEHKAAFYLAAFIWMLAAWIAAFAYGRYYS